MLTPSLDRSSEEDEPEQNRSQIYQGPDLQLYSFRWVEFEESIRRSYQQLREERIFNDVTISCENSEVEAHKIVLATSSDFFSRLLQRSSFRSNPHPIIFINDVKMKHFKFILDFMYEGEVKVPRNDTTAVLQAVELLEIKDFKADDFKDFNETKDFQADDFHDENTVEIGIGKRRATEFPSSSTWSSPEKRSRCDSWSPVPSSSRGSSPCSLQPKININHSYFFQENAQHDCQEKDKENTEDDCQEKDKENTEDDCQEKDKENTEDGGQEKDIENRQDNTENDSHGKDKENMQDYAEDGSQEKDKENQQDNTENGSHEKDKENMQDYAEDGSQEKDKENTEDGSREKDKENSEDGSREKDVENIQDNTENDSHEKDKENTGDGSQLKDKENTEDGSREKDKEKKQENATDGNQKKQKRDRQEAAEDCSQEKDKEDIHEKDEKLEDQEDVGENDNDYKLENANQSVLELSELGNAVILAKASDEKIDRETKRAALVEKVGSGMFKCKQCGYTSKTVFNVKKHAEAHLSPRKYKCHLCPSVVKNEFYFKAHMRTKHGMKLKTVNAENQKLMESQEDSEENDNDDRVGHVNKSVGEPSWLSNAETPREYKCNMCQSVLKNQVYFKAHMKTKHGINLKTVCWLKKE